jgi:hypothetical protein
VEYSFLSDDRLAIWVLDSTGELLASLTVRTPPTCTTLITAALKSIVAPSHPRQSAEDAEQEINRDQEKLGLFYQHLLAPVESHLEGATEKAPMEVLIVPHKELFKVPWAALFNSKTGQYLIQRYVLRVAPSLRVARTAADTLRDIKGPKEQGHALVVGNPLPTRSPPLCGAEEEAELVSARLMSVGFACPRMLGSLCQIAGSDTATSLRVQTYPRAACTRKSWSLEMLSGLQYKPSLFLSLPPFLTSLSLPYHKAKRRVGV